MKIISAKKLSDSLAKAQGIGLVEEPVTIVGCQLVVRNLRPDEYRAIHAELQELQEMDYMFEMQVAHVSRAIVELNGADLRDVKFVETEEEDPKTGQPRPIKLELHKYLNQEVISTWSKEALLIAYRKVGDVATLAEEKVKEGVTFRVPDETAEEKFRRLLGEVKELYGELPIQVIDRTLGEFGLMSKTTDEELRAMQDELAKIEQPEAPEASKTVTLTAEELMRMRVPMNQAPPEGVPLVREGSAPPPDPSSRSAQIADLEAEAPAALPDMPPRLENVPELSRKATPVNPREVQAIFDRPPSGGINPRFRPPPR